MMLLCFFSKLVIARVTRRAGHHQCKLYRYLPMRAVCTAVCASREFLELPGVRP